MDPLRKANRSGSWRKLRKSYGLQLLLNFIIMSASGWAFNPIEPPASDRPALRNQKAHVQRGVIQMQPGPLFPGENTENGACRERSRHLLTGNSRAQ